MAARRSQAAAWAYRRYRALRHRTTDPCWNLGLYSLDPSSNWVDAYRVTLALTQSFVEMSEANGVIPLILAVPSACQLRHGRLRIPGVDLRRPQEALRTALGDEVPFIDLYTPLEREARARRDATWYSLPGDGHFTVEGHAYLARILAREIDEQLRLKARPAATP
jgi:hypothetical protein